jgi:NAD(P)H-hydrate epimerase
MENAGKNAAAIVAQEAVRKRVVIVCGTGNNGGDGLVVARHLAIGGTHVDVLLVGSPARLSADAKTNHDAWIAMGGPVVEIDPAKDVALLERALTGAGLLVDALFGTGLDRPIAKPMADVVAAMNAARVRTIALDVPSGIDTNTGRTLGVAVRSDATVTFAHHKTGLLTPNGAAHTGRLHVVSIGVPSSLVSGTGHAAEMLERTDARSFVPPRPVDAHKHTAGHLAVLAGSPGKIGAALMVALGALRAGAGAATIATWPEAATALESHVVEVMTARLTTDKASIDRALAAKRAVVLGPGFGTGDDARAVIEHVLTTFGGPIVLDADALTVVATDLGLVHRAKGPVVLTPHAGELARLLGVTSADVEADRFASVRSAAQRARAIVLLKGPHTLVATPEGRTVVNSSGNPTLATAGSGDVLAGMVGAFVCHAGPFEAACAAAYVHGAAADAWKTAHGGADRGMLATEIAELIPDAISALHF